MYAQSLTKLPHGVCERCDGCSHHFVVGAVGWTIPVAVLVDEPRLFKGGRHRRSIFPRLAACGPTTVKPSHLKEEGREEGRTGGREGGRKGGR